MFYFLLAKIVALAGYPAIETGYPAGYRISKKDGYPVQPYIKKYFFRGESVEKEQKAPIEKVPLVTMVKKYTSRDLLME